MHQGFLKLDLYPRWAPSLAVSVLLTGLLLATMCSAQCLGEHCDSPAPSEAAQHHHSAPLPEPAPDNSSRTPENGAPESGNCSGHGYSGDFVAQSPSQALKARFDHSWKAAPLADVSQRTLPGVLSIAVAAFPAETHSPPQVPPAATPLRI